MHLYIYYRWIVTTSGQVDMWTSCLFLRQGNIVSGQVNEWTSCLWKRQDNKVSERVACYKEKIVLMLPCLWYKQLVYSSNLFTRLLVNHITLSLFTINLFTCLLVHSSTIVNLIHRLKIRRALIPFELTPFWLAKDAL